MAKMKKNIIVATALALSCVLANTAVMAKNTTADIQFDPGSLVLKEAPIYKFGNHDVSVNTETYPALPGASNFIEIHDARGSFGGWSLSVKLSEFQNSGTPSLAGAELSITPEPNFTNNGPGTPPTSSNVTLVSGAPAARIASATNGSGAGISKNTPPTVNLKVYAGTASPGNHEATLEWALTDAP